MPSTRPFQYEESVKNQAAILNLNEASRPNIFEFHDYLEFLRAWLNFLKATEPNFSIRKLLNTLGLASGYMSMCLSEKRVISEKVLRRLLPVLKMTAQERRVFTLLYALGTAQSPQDRLLAVTELSRLSGFREKNGSDLESYRYLTSWHYVAIREMVALNDFQPDAAWIQTQLKEKVSQADCEEALRFLVDKNLIRINDDGRYVVSDKTLDCKAGIFKLSLGEFHRQALTLGIGAIETTPREELHMLGHTVAINRHRFQEVKDILNEALAKIEKLAESCEERGQVFHVELAAFPLTIGKTDRKDETGNQ